jgi:hypothetical protein
LISENGIMVKMFHLKDTKEIKELKEKWAELKKKKYLESMKSGLTKGKN